MGAMVLGTRQQLEIQTICKVSQGELSQAQARELLGVSERTLRRWLRAYEREGIAFVRHGNKGKPPSNKRPEALKQQIMAHVEAELYDFNMLHALEKLQEKFDLKINRETFRRWCREKGLVKRAHGARRPKPRYKRPRYAQAGFMLQLDGSPHRWFGGVESCLIAAIDDATSSVVGAEFFPTESMFSTFKVLSEAFANHGLPSVLYVDRAGMYGGQKRTNFSQLARALEELGVQVIYANSPEGKGRIERLFGTLQDRLVPEMRVKRIDGYGPANEYLKDIYMPHVHNPRFAVQAQSLKPAWRPLAPGTELSDVFCVKERRRVARDHTFSYEGERYLITTDLKFSIYNHDLELRIDAASRMRALFAGRELSYAKVTKCPKRIAA